MVSLQGLTVGYLFLEDCEVQLKTAASTPAHTWFDVKIPLSLHDRKAASVDHDTNNNIKKVENDSNKPIACRPCHQCHLVLETNHDDQDDKNTVKPLEAKARMHQRPIKSEEGKNPRRKKKLKPPPPPPPYRLVDVGPRYDGTILGTKANDKVCSCGSRRRRPRSDNSGDRDYGAPATPSSSPLAAKQRSDAALLVGTALTVQDYGHVTIRTLQFCLADEEDEDHKNNVDGVAIGCFVTRKAAILVTLICREIVRTPPPSMSSTMVIKSEDGVKQKQKINRTAVAVGGNRRYLTNSSKAMPSSTQLLLSLMRSDWKALTEKINEWTTKRNGGERKRKETLFPTQMSLAAIYRRIGGASSAFGYQPEVSPTSSDGSQSMSLSLARLPPDVLCHHIGHFLKAPALDSLRCTCKRLHYTLRSVVPGLKLELYAHQIRSLSWMRMRETKIVTESDLVRESSVVSSTRYSGSTSQDSDVHRAATGGASVALSPRKVHWQEQDSRPAPIVRISQSNGDEIEIDGKEDPLSRTVARGGLLCDDPGLGKSITVLSLILQTMGLSTEGKTNELGESEPETLTEERIFREYWKEQLISEVRVQELTKLFQTFLRSSVEIFYFFDEVDPKSKNVPDYLNDVPNPICLKDIRDRVGANYYGASFHMFQNEVTTVFKNTVENTPADSIWALAARRLILHFSALVADFKNARIAIAKKSFSSTTAKPNSSVAALVEQNSKLKLKKSLVQSKSTLLVVPSILLDHWQEQVKMHVDANYCTESPGTIPITFSYSGNANETRRMAEVTEKVAVDKTHFPFVFVDKAGSKKLPPPLFLSMFRIVITTNQRFSNEWKNGSFEAEIKRQNKEKANAGTTAEIFFEMRRNLAAAEEACPLLKVNWLRMIVDEGHSMSKGKTSSIFFASWINAERRWATTGTPTPENQAQNGLANLLHLTEYLQHDFFSHRNGGEAIWNNLIVRAWNRGCLSAFFRLRSLLSLLMVHHTKADIDELPQPKKSTVRLPMSTEEVTAYNTLVCAVQSNLLITGMKGAKTSGQQDSLIHKSQTKHAREVLSNIRTVCVGSSLVCPTLSDKNWTESIEDFDAINSDHEQRRSFRDFLSRATTGQLSPCDCCQIMLATLLVCPCGHLVCTECMDNPNTEASCVVCEEKLNVDQFQKIQPGFEYKWLHNIEEEEKAATGNGDDDERQEAAIQNNQGIGNVFARMFAPRVNRTRHRFGDGHVCAYDATRTDGKCRLCLTEHDRCYLVNERKQCATCFRVAEDCPIQESKNHYLTKTLLNLYTEQEAAKKSFKPVAVPEEYEGMGTKRPLKVIVFSQFRLQLNLIGDRLLRRFGPGCVAEYWGMYRRQELHKFTTDPGCFILLLGRDGSEGLDLSFVTHIWFVEPLWDRSLESQVEARAWRMGATESVRVETLVAEATIEETMESANKSDFDFAPAAPGKKSIENQARLHFYLQNLKLITNAATLGFASGAKHNKSLNAEEAEGPVMKKQKRSGERMPVRFQEEEEFEVNVN